MHSEFSYVVSFYMLVDAHRQCCHSNPMVRYLPSRKAAMENRTNMNDRYYYRQISVSNESTANGTYRLSELSRKPLANGLLSIFNCVTYKSVGDETASNRNRETYISVLISSNCDELCFRKRKSMFGWRIRFV